MRDLIQEDEMMFIFSTNSKFEAIHQKMIIYWSKVTFSNFSKFYLRFYKKFWWGNIHHNAWICTLSSGSLNYQQIENEKPKKMHVCPFFACLFISSWINEVKKKQLPKDSHDSLIQKIRRVAIIGGKGLELWT